jgi:hypothetical protein
MVLFFCDEFRELPNLTLDLSQAEKKITVVTSWATQKIKTIFSQNDNFDIENEDLCNITTYGIKMIVKSGLEFFYFEIPFLVMLGVR